MLFNLSQFAPNARYHLMNQVVIPRPIAWVLTPNGEQSATPYNLAPFSYFNAVSSNPPLVMFSVGHKSDGSKKDTWHNIETFGQCVIHIPSAAQLADMVNSAKELPHGETELQLVEQGDLVFEQGWQLPRLAQAPVAMHCKLHHIHLIEPQNQGVVFCEIDHLFVDDLAITQKDERTVIDPTVIKPVSRLGGELYHILNDYISYKRP